MFAYTCVYVNARIIIIIFFSSHFYMHFIYCKLSNEYICKHTHVFASITVYTYDISGIHFIIFCI